MNTDNSASAISTCGLGKRFGSYWALEECTIEVPRRRVSALVGPNGAGKTTLLRLLVGLAAPSAGDALVLGRHLEQSEDFLTSIGYLAQDVCYSAFSPPRSMAKSASAISSSL
jgi:ABC-2 type transport system ATP-binding protein